MFNSLNKIIAGLLFISIAVGCKKELNVPPPPPPDDTEWLLINSGYVVNSNTNSYEPCYWINDSLCTLPFADGLQAYAYGIESNNQDLYFAGYYSPKAAPAGIDALPCYWKNNVKYNLPIRSEWSFNISTARDVKLWNGKLYITGHYDYHQVIWIVEPGGNTSIIEVAPEAYTIESSLKATGNIVVENNKMYMGGVQAKELNDRVEVEVGYWTLEPDNKLNWHRTKDHLAYALAFAIAVSGNKVYLTGEFSTDFTASSPAKMVLWDGADEMNLSPVSNPPALRLSELKIDEAGFLHTNLYDFEHHRPLIFKISKAGYVQAINPVIPTGVRGYTNNVALAPGKVAYSGYYYGQNGTFGLWSWINGEMGQLKLSQQYRFASLSSSKWVRLKKN